MYQFKRTATLIIATAACLGLQAQKKNAGAQQNNFSVSGIVKNAATGKPARGVRVKYKEFSAAITDSAGVYRIKVPGSAVMLTLEGDGYQTKEVAVQGQRQVNTVIYEDGFTSSSDDADLVQGRTTRTMAPNAISTIAVNDGWSRTNETPDAYLQGKAAGLNVIRRSGTQNIGASIMLRGINSLYATNQPLIIVDGVIFNNSSVGGSIVANFYSNPLSTIDVRDIDNITVLKDASALYGSKGSNGAIIISTIRAKELGTKIDFAVYGGYNDVPKNIPVMKAADYRVYLSEILKSKGLSDADIQKQPYMNDDPANAGYYRYHNETDWQNLVMQKAYTKNVYLKVTGGDNIAKYALSLGFLNNDGLTKNTDLSKYNMRFNGDLNLSRRMTATTNLSFTFSEQKLRDQGSASEVNPLFLALVKAPFLRTNDVSATGVESPTIADRDTLNISNPVAIINSGQGLNKAYRFLGSVGFNYAFNRNFNLSTTVGVVYNKVRESFFVPRKGVVPDTLSNAVAFSRLGSQVTSLFDLFNDTRLTFTKTIGKLNNVSARIGVRYMKEKTEQDYGLGYNSAIDELVSVGNGVNALRKVGGEIGESKWVNSYVNVDYVYSDRYFLSAGLASDASSRFGLNIPGALKVNGNVFSMFPSVAGAWIISNEKGMVGSKIDLLKLRASYSEAGNDDIGNYTAQQTYVSQNLLGMQGLVRAGIANDQLQWELVKKINIGADIAILKERLQVSVDLFSHKTDKMIVYEPAPTASGFDYMVTNSGGLKNTGYELSVNGRLVNTKSFKWDAGFNVGRYKTKVMQLPSSRILTSFSGATYITQTGSTPNAFYGYQAYGVYASDLAAAADGFSVRKTDGTLAPFKGGDMKFADLNGDKIIDDNDRTILGSPNPNYFGSIFTTLTYKRISLNALFTFSKGNEIYNYTRAQLEGMSNVYNQTQAVVNRWKNNGEITTMPRATWGDPMGNARFSSRWIEDGSYLRLRTLTISYDVPLKSNFFKNATVYATGNNLFTLTKYKGYDPEFSATESIFGQGVDNTLEPQIRTAQIGFRIGL